MADLVKRETRTWTDWVEISHYFGQNESYGDTTFDATATADSFEINLSQCKGRDRDNYGHYHNAEIKLNEDEARDLYLLLHMWLEQR